MIKNHIHSYVRVAKKQYQCSDPDCTSKQYAVYLKGKRTLCPKCLETTFILTPRHLKLARPLCLNCSDTAEAREYRELKKNLENIGVI